MIPKGCEIGRFNLGYNNIQLLYDRFNSCNGF